MQLHKVSCWNFVLKNLFIKTHVVVVVVVVFLSLLVSFCLIVF